MTSRLLPNEMWEVVILCLWSDKLKTIRLVNSAIKDFATPLLSHHVGF